MRRPRRNNIIVPKFPPRFPKPQSYKAPSDFSSIGGTFCSTIPRDQQPHLLEEGEKATARWKKCDSVSYHAHSPLVAKPQSVNSSNEKGNGSVELGKLMVRARALPDNWYFSNSIIFVNKARVSRQIPPLSRDVELDGFAQAHASNMAKHGRVAHSISAKLRFELARPCRRLGENVAVGSSIKEIHKEMMATAVASQADKNNILDRRYTCMGVGTAKGENGLLYICQLFKA